MTAAIYSVSWYNAMRTTHRRNYKKGDWLVVDERTGQTHYASEMAREPDTGLWVHRDSLDPRHPQLKLRPKYRDPKPLAGPIVPSPVSALAQHDIIVDAYIGGTTIQRCASPADHIFGAGIGEFIIEGDVGCNEFTTFLVSATTRAMFPSGPVLEPYFRTEVHASLMAQGARTNTTSGGVSIPYADGVREGELLILRAGHLNAGSEAAATWTFPDDWSLRWADQVNSQRNWVYSKVAKGTEVGNVMVSSSGGTTQRYGVIDRWGDIDTTTDHGIYGASLLTGTSATVGDADVTTSAAGDMAVQIIAQSISGTTIGDFAGESGGNWTMDADGGAGAPVTGIAYASAATPTGGRIGGGTYTISSGVWIVRGFCLRSRSG